ncbi:MAG: SMP-30/gluconolactonase/LRE family protein [Inquilinaceae bacterium]
MNVTGRGPLMTALAMMASAAIAPRAEADPSAMDPRSVETVIERLDPAMDAIVAGDATIEQFADGFAFVDGPVWDRADNALYSSEIPTDRIYRWSQADGLTLFLENSGYDNSGSDIGEYNEPGTNGLTIGPDGLLTMNQLGNRAVARLEADGSVTQLAHRFNGKRLNSPNDLVYRSDGVLFFTDPPFGLPDYFDDPRKDLPYSGVFRVDGNRIHLVSRDLTGPNGLAFSPDEPHLYVANWNTDQRILMRYDVDAQGALSGGRVFFDFADAEETDQAPDGLKVDVDGNVYVAGPGGIWVISPAGDHLGTIRGPQRPLSDRNSEGRTTPMTPGRRL